MVSEENLVEQTELAIGTGMTNESTVIPGTRSTGDSITDEHAADRTTRIVHGDKRHAG